jgi:hypothetical protein
VPGRSQSNSHRTDTDALRVFRFLQVPETIEWE